MEEKHSKEMLSSVLATIGALSILMAVPITARTATEEEIEEAIADGMIEKFTFIAEN